MADLRRYFNQYDPFFTLFKPASMIFDIDISESIGNISLSKIYGYLYYEKVCI